MYQSALGLALKHIYGSGDLGPCNEVAVCKPEGFPTRINVCFPLRQRDFSPGRMQPRNVRKLVDVGLLKLELVLSQICWALQQTLAKAFFKMEECSKWPSRPGMLEQSCSPVGPGNLCSCLSHGNVSLSISIILMQKHVPHSYRTDTASLSIQSVDYS